MKIVHVETGRHFYGGAQQVVWLAQGLMARGIENLLVVTPHSAIEAVARNAGIPVVALRCSGDLDLAFAWRLRQLLDAQRPDIVHCHSRRGADFLGGQAAAMAGIPAIVSRRVDNAEPVFISGLRYRQFTRVVAISDHIASILRAAGLDAGRLAVIRSAVDAAQIATTRDRPFLEREFGIAADQFAVAVVAQLIPRKGHRYLLDAVRCLRDTHPDIRVVAFGTGALERELKAVARQLGLADIVKFAGFREDLDGFLASFDLLVHPALREGLGVAMLKAAAACVPVVAFDAAGAREAVEQERTGLLVPTEDSVALAAAIARLIAAPELRREFGAAGRARMREKFSIEHMVGRYVELYKEVLIEQE